jgi:hypothetical protein
MSKELDSLAKEYQRKSVTVMTKHALLDKTNLQTEIAQFIRDVERQCKKQNSVYVKFVVVVE